MSREDLNHIISQPLRRQNLEARFWPKLQRAPSETACWEWQASVQKPNGYGRMTAGRGINLKAHMVAWALHNGPIPEGLCVLHTCDNPRCCNPAHLFLGTKKDNTHDMLRKGRNVPPPHSFGEDHHKAKFSQAIALAIKNDKRPAHIIADQYGISTKTVYRLRRGETWRELT